MMGPRLPALFELREASRGQKGSRNPKEKGIKFIFRFPNLFEAKFFHG
jgi:hypothetical protein